MDEKIVKGANYVYTKDYIIKTYGLPKWQQILDKLSKPSAMIWSNNLILIDSFPFEPYYEIIKTLAEVCGLNSTEELGKVYEYIAHKSLNSVYQMFLSLTQPSFVLSRYPLLWKRFFNTGMVKINHIEKGKAEIEFGLPASFKEWITPACYGFSKAAIEMAGGSQFNQKLRTSEVSDSGEWKFVYDLTWLEK